MLFIFILALVAYNFFRMLTINAEDKACILSALIKELDLANFFLLRRFGLPG
jgi:hypothetical protein